MHFTIVLKKIVLFEQLFKLLYVYLSSILSDKLSKSLFTCIEYE